jgi:hypothetical protein
MKNFLKENFTKERVVRFAVDFVTIMAIAIAVDVIYEGSKVEYKKFAEFYGPKGEKEEVAPEQN